MNCTNCKSYVSDVEDTCHTCGTYAGPPNVRTAERERDRLALEERYKRALEESKTRGTYDEMIRFDEAMKRSCAVINVDIDYLHQFLTQDNLLYSNYELRVKSQSRKPAVPADDKRRRAIDDILFGSYADNIRFAALSLDGSGLKSYGPYAIKLLEITVQHRSTLLEENSYDFVPRHGITPGDEVPAGYLATWRERHKLAVAKVAGRISPGIAEADYPRILLSSDGNRPNDRFIEVHIYKAFDNKAVESVKGSSHVKARPDEERKQRALLSIVKDRLKNAGKNWIEE